MGKISIEVNREYIKRYWEKKAAATGCSEEEIPEVAARIRREQHSAWNKAHRDRVALHNHRYYISHTVKNASK